MVGLRSLRELGPPYGCVFDRGIQRRMAQQRRNETCSRYSLNAEATAALGRVQLVFQRLHGHDACLRIARPQPLSEPPVP